MEAQEVFLLGTIYLPQGASVMSDKSYEFLQICMLCIQTVLLLQELRLFSGSAGAGAGSHGRTAEGSVQHILLQ